MPTSLRNLDVRAQNTRPDPSPPLFAGLYALYAGLVFLVAAGLVFAPLMHHVLHRFHWDRNR